MKTMKLFAMGVVAVIALTGCGATKGIFGKYDNGSLDYRDATKLTPMQLPANQPAAEFIPLYRTPAVQTNLPDYTNEAGRQYELPRPPSVTR